MTPQDVEIVERFRTQIEICLLAGERYTTNDKRYQVDVITGLLTRRYFEDLLRLSLDQVTRHQDCFVLALFDVDELKYVNDTYGHLAGDQMLLSVPNVLRASCRNSDVIGRLGGDEFIASYHLIDIKAMEKNIANIRNRLRACTTRLGDTEHRLSFTYGLAHPRRRHGPGRPDGRYRQTPVRDEVGQQVERPARKKVQPFIAPPARLPSQRSLTASCLSCLRGLPARPDLDYS